MKFTIEELITLMELLEMEMDGWDKKTAKTSHRYHELDTIHHKVCEAYDSIVIRKDGKEKDNE